MASSTYHSIVIRAANQQGDVTREECVAGEANITPGELLEHSAGTLLRHNTAAGVVVPKMVALESQTPDGESTFAIDEDYDNGDVVYYAVPKAGERYYMWLAAGENASQHDLLQSDGDGALAVLAAPDATTITESIVGRAVAAVDNSLGAVPARVVVEIA